MSLDFPFSIKQEASLLPLKVLNKNDVYMEVKCPFCGKGRLNINFVKNMYNCRRCNTGGGLTTLYAKIHNISNSDSYFEIMSILGLSTSETGVITYNKANTLTLTAEKQISEVISDKVSDYTLDQTYRTLCSLLGLKDIHYNNLIERGLSKIQIKKNLYCSTPDIANLFLICKNLIAMGCTLQGVPGFYKSNNNWTMNFTALNSGIIIPIFNLEGLIVGMQIRSDNSNAFKYTWFSSNGKNKGCSSGSPIHFIGNIISQDIWLTEGALKGTIAYYLDNIDSFFGCLAGVQNYKALYNIFPILKGLGVKNVFSAYDMDKFINSHVLYAEKQLHIIARECNLNSMIYNWNPNLDQVNEFYNGLSANIVPILNENNEIYGFNVISYYFDKCSFIFKCNENEEAFNYLLKNSIIRVVYFTYDTEKYIDNNSILCQQKILKIIQLNNISGIFKDWARIKNKGIDDYRLNLKNNI